MILTLGGYFKIFPRAEWNILEITAPFSKIATSHYYLQMRLVVRQSMV